MTPLEMCLQLAKLEGYEPYQNLVPTGEWYGIHPIFGDQPIPNYIHNVAYIHRYLNTLPEKTQQGIREKNHQKLRAIYAPNENDILAFIPYSAANNLILLETTLQCMLPQLFQSEPLPVREASSQHHPLYQTTPMNISQTFNQSLSTTPCSSITVLLKPSQPAQEPHSTNWVSSEQSVERKLPLDSVEQSTKS